MSCSDLILLPVVSLAPFEHASLFAARVDGRGGRGFHASPSLFRKIDMMVAFCWLI
jgi:hypothetical protein